MILKWKESQEESVLKKLKKQFEATLKGKMLGKITLKEDIDYTYVDKWFFFQMSCW